MHGLWVFERRKVCVDKSFVSPFGCMSCMYRDDDGYCFNKYSPKETTKVDDDCCFLHRTDLEKFHQIVRRNILIKEEMNNAESSEGSNV